MIRLWWRPDSCPPVSKNVVDRAKGIVIRTNPTAGTQTAKGSAVTYYVSTGARRRARTH